jgi:hypothetical protein
MSAAEILAAEISEPYPYECVCFVDIDHIDPHDMEFRSARVVGHGKHDAHRSSGRSSGERATS